MTAYVYFLASQRNGTLYVGVMRDLSRRTFEHVQGVNDGFTRRYDVKRLVYAERFERIDEAIAYEKRLKRWRRGWKVELIEASNPDWLDLRETWVP